VPHYTFLESVLMCEGVPLHEIARRFGTPLYVYSKGDILEKCRTIESAFDGSPHLTYYAVKANANPVILRHIAHEGLGADVGSKGEMYLALQAGFRPDQITFSGVGKQDDEIAYALDQGIRAFNVESAQEIDVIDQSAARAGRKAGLLLRVNLDIDAGGHAYVSTSRKQNKFGVPRDRAGEVFYHASTLRHVEVRGVHSHIGSQITNVETFLTAARSLAELITELRQAGNHVHELDFGGGYGVQYHGFLAHPQLPEEQAERAGLSTVTMIRKVLPVLQQTGCAIAIQPGRSIVAEAGALLVRVLYRKENGEKTFIVVDGGMNDLIRPSLYHAHHQIVPLVLRNAPHEKADVVGPVCESGDFFAQDRLLSRVERGDYLGIMCAGAYGYVITSNYNARLRPAEVLVEGDGCKLIRERESLEDLLP
jgi:diaminopimelate decarboxylase